MDNSNCIKCRKCGSSWLEFEEDGRTEHCRICGYIYDPELPPTIGNLRDCIRCGSAVEASSESNLCDECTRDVGAAAFNKEDIEVAKRENRCVIVILLSSLTLIKKGFSVIEQSVKMLT